MRDCQDRTPSGRKWRFFALGVVGLFSIVSISLVALVVHQRLVDNETRAAVERSYVLRARMQRVFSLMQDVETGARGYVIAGRPEFLKPYVQARAELPRDLLDLDAAAAASHQTAFSGPLHKLISENLEVAHDMIELRRHHHVVDADVLVRTGEGKQAMDQLRVVLAQWERQERAELETRLSAANNASRRLSLGLAGLGAAVAAIVLATLWVAAQLARSRDEANAASRAKSAFLAMMSHELRTPLMGCWACRTPSPPRLSMSACGHMFG